MGRGSGYSELYVVLNITPVLQRMDSIVLPELQSHKCGIEFCFQIRLIHLEIIGMNTYFKTEVFNDALSVAVNYMQ